ncbi:CotH kinase family protein [Syntrophomonas curvata]
MITNKHLNIFIVLLMIAAVLGTAFLALSPPESGSTAEPEYVSKLFDKDKIIEINIDMEQDDFDWIIENATREEYRSCDITVNGATFNNVGIRPKGNSSLRTVAQDDTSDRFSFKVDFDAYIEGQTCFGLNKLALNNIIMDKTYMKEYLAYDMFAFMGVVTPEYAYADISVNGKPWGLYLAVEAMEESFVKRNYGSLAGHLYRPEGAGSDLKWTGESAANYSGIRKMAAYDVADSDFKKIITMIEHLNNGADLENYLDVDSILRYFAVNTFLVNFDSYTGTLKHNYYLYEENGVCTILPWDFNLAFAGHEINDADKAVNHPIDTPTTANLSERPLIGKLLEVPKYKELYHKYLNQLVEDYVNSGAFEDTVQKVDRLINSSVKNDATAFTAYAEYEKSLPVLVEFAKLRGQSISAQLSGKQPATAAEQSNNTAQNIDAGSIDLSALGGMGGRGGKRPAGSPPQQGGVALPGGNSPDKGQEPGAFGGGSPHNNNNRDGEPGALPGAGEPGSNIAGERPGGFPGGNRPGPEIMMKAREIMQDANGSELSAEQTARLRELGLDDSMIERMKNMPPGMPGQDGGRDRAGNPPPGNRDNDPFGSRNSLNRLAPAQKACIAISTGCVLPGLLFVWRFKRRRYSS